MKTVAPPEASAELTGEESKKWTMKRRTARRASFDPKKRLMSSASSLFTRSADTSRLSSRSTCVQLLRAEAARLETRKNGGDAFVAACKRWKITSSNKTKHCRKTASQIADKVNAMCGTNVQVELMRKHVNKGKCGCAPELRGAKSKIPKDIQRALESAVTLHVQLTSAGMKDDVNRPVIIKKLATCLKEGGSEHGRCDKPCERMTSRIADHVVVNDDDNRIEQRRLAWTTWSNINIWFDVLKLFLTDKGFAREKRVDDGDIEGELVFHKGQTDRFINLDESKASADGTAKFSGGRPVTQLSSADSSTPTGASAANRSRCSAAFIRGSNLSGWPLPIHIQAKSNATAKNQKLEVQWLKNEKVVCGVCGEGKKVKKGMTIGANSKAGMDAIKFEKYLMNRIVPLHNDTQDVAGKRVAIIVDSGPGRLEVSMLAKL